MFVKGEGRTILHKNLHPKGATWETAQRKCCVYRSDYMLKVFINIILRELGEVEEIVGCCGLQPERLGHPDSCRGFATPGQSGEYVKRRTVLQFIVCREDLCFKFASKSIIAQNGIQRRFELLCEVIE